MDISKMKLLLTGSLDEKLQIVSELTEQRLARLLGIDLDVAEYP